MRLRLLALALLVGCAPSFPAFDRAAPDLTVLRGALDGPVVFTTRADLDPADTACPDGTRPHLPPDAGSAERRRLTNENHILPAGMDRVLLIFAVTDPSGVERVELGFPTRGVAPITPGICLWSRSPCPAGAARIATPIPTRRCGAPRSARCDRPISS